MGCSQATRVASSAACVPCVKLVHSGQLAEELQEELKRRIQMDFGLAVNVQLVEVQCGLAKDYYKICVGRNALFDWKWKANTVFEWARNGEGKVTIRKAPGPAWTAPINFLLHEDLLGPGADFPCPGCAGSKRKLMSRSGSRRPSSSETSFFVNGECNRCLKDGSAKKRQMYEELKLTIQSLLIAAHTEQMTALPGCRAAL